MNSSQKDPANRTAAVVRLSQRQREAILLTLGHLPDRPDLLAICAYGSTVAGYARSDSDYDIIAVIESFKQRIRYHYLHGPAEVSALVVDAKMMLNDAKRASLGEFVVGRLLNVYDPLKGTDFFADVELEFKKRVMIEELQEVVVSQGDFSNELLIPPSYFLFEKLRKRASIYPPALYSYCHTYSEELKKENLQPALRAFEEAARLLAKEGVLAMENSLVKISRGSLSFEGRTRLRSALSRTARGIRQYAAHGYAGRVGLGVVAKELTSKMKRRKETGALPEEIRQPKNLWRIEEGSLVWESDGWLRATAEALGFSQNVKEHEEEPQKLYYSSRVYVLQEGARRVSVIVKKFRDVSALKWAFLKVWASPGKVFDLAPLSRLHREYHAVRTLREFGLNTPDVLCVMLPDRIMVTKFVEGRNLGEIVSSVLAGDSSDAAPISAYGEALAVVHKNQYALGDTKPSNVILSQDKLFLVDLEQASGGGDKSWDVAEFLYYSSKLSLSNRGAKLITEAFLDGYLKEGEEAIVEKALRLKYFAPFQPVILPTVAKTIRDTVRARLRS